MARPSQNFTPPVYHAPAFDAVSAVGVATAAVAAFILVAAALPPGLPALAAAQGIGLAGVPIGAALVLRRPLVSLGLGRPRALAIVGAALFGASFWYANLRAWSPLIELLDQGELPALERRLLGGADLPWRLIAIALVPAVCEELTMRGALARSLHPLGTRLAVVVSAAAFAAFHMSLLRMGPTFALGLVLATVTLRTGTIWPAVTAHLLNNAVALLVADDAIPHVAALTSSHPTAALGVALLLAGGGIALAMKRPAS
jgi:membrane protease YdiL (CAAX protease family)